MLGRTGVILAAAALSLGATPAGHGGLWEGGAQPQPQAAPVDSLTAEGRASRGPCELAGADRARTSSTRCIACHDGSTGAPIEFRMAPDATGGMSHPVEVDYDAASLRDPTHYHPSAALPREVPLVNGKVTCTSCHDGASPDPKRVAMVPRLCESCHAL